MIGTTFYHGSAVPSHSALKVDWDRENTFGPAIYLTTEPSADCNVPYPVKLNANQLLTINLDKSFGEQTVEAKEAILKTRKTLGLPKLPGKNTNVKQLIYCSGQCSKSMVNKVLLEHGIWMLYGRFDCDRVASNKRQMTQYAVIDASAVIPDRELFQKSILLQSAG